MAETKIPTQAEALQALQPATEFADRFVLECPELAARAAYHRALAAGFDRQSAAYIEVRVSGMEKAARAEQKRARNEWAEENRAAFMGSV